MRFVLLPFLATSSALAGPASTDALNAHARPERPVAHIVGGEVTNRFPGTVALYWDGEFGCTGTIVAPDRVMTAAHCLEDGNPTHIMQGPELGEGDFVPVRSGWMHPDYDFYSTVAADIAVLVLEADIGPVIPIDRTAAEDLVHSDIIYAGYGDTQGTAGAGFRKEASATITDLEGDVLVVEVGDGGACFGDSGGPLYRQDGGELTVVGAVSFGYTDDCMDPGGNTRADIYADWVLTVGEGDAPVLADEEPEDGFDDGQASFDDAFDACDALEDDDDFYACLDELGFDDEAYGGCSMTGARGLGSLALFALVAPLLRRRRV